MICTFTPQSVFLPMATKLWLQHGEKIKGVVPLQCHDIDDFITLIRKDSDVRDQLKIPKDCGTIKLYRSNGAALDVGLTLQDLR